MPNEINRLAHSHGFTKTMTSCAKGLALILLFVHHIIPNNPGVNLSITELSISQVLATSAKSCVSMFMILSGYGICFKFSKTDGSFPKWPWLLTIGCGNSGRLLSRCTYSHCWFLFVSVFRLYQFTVRDLVFFCFW